MNSLTQQIISDSSGPGDAPLSDEDAACFAVGLIDFFGGERIAAEIDLEFEEFMANASSAERREVVDIMLECVDFAAMMTAEFPDGVSPESAKCVSNAFVGSEALRNAMAESFATPGSDPFDDPAVEADLLPAMLDCLSAEELLRLGDEGQPRDRGQKTGSRRSSAIC